MTDLTKDQIWHYLSQMLNDESSAMISRALSDYAARTGGPERDLAFQIAFLFDRTGE